MSKSWVNEKTFFVQNKSIDIHVTEGWLDFRIEFDILIDFFIIRNYDKI